MAKRHTSKRSNFTCEMRYTSHRFICRAINLAINSTRQCLSTIIHPISHRGYRRTAHVRDITWSIEMVIRKLSHALYWPRKMASVNQGTSPVGAVIIFVCLLLES